MAGYGVLPTDPRFLELTAEPHLLYFAYWYLKKNRRDLFTRLEQVLGTTWTVEDLTSTSKQKTDPNADLFIPLSLAIRPDLLDKLQKICKIRKVVPQEGDVVETSELPKEQWEQFAQIIHANFGRMV